MIGIAKVTYFASHSNPKLNIDLMDIKTDFLLQSRIELTDLFIIYSIMDFFFLFSHHHQCQRGKTILPLIARINLSIVSPLFLLVAVKNIDLI